MLLGIRRDLGTRTLVAAFLAVAPLLTLSGTAVAAPNAALRISPSTRIANPSPSGIRRYQPSTPRARALSKFPPRRGGALSISPPRGGGGGGGARLSSPGTGAQLIQDPGFELGPINTYWAESSSGGFEIISPSNPHSGRYSADLCGYTNDTPACQDVVGQQLNFNLPSGIISAQFSYWFWIGSQEPPSSCATTSPVDYLTLGVFDATNTADPANAATYCAADWGDQQWHQQSINVTTYLQGHVGQSLTVKVQGIDDANNLASEFFVDDLALSIYTAPSAPTSVLAQADNSAATISWQAPPDGGSPITSYTVTPYTNTGGSAGTPVVFNSPSTIDVLPGLLNGTAYTFTVAAMNAYATGAASGQSNSAIPDRSYNDEVASTNQFTLANSDGVTWQPMDPNYLSTSVTPASDSLAIVNSNVDLWTANAGFNQDIGIAVSGGTGVGTTYPSISGQPEAWKESGGYAGTFSPNAASVHTVLALKGASTYTFTLVWKTNKPASGTNIFAGAGPIGGVYSPTRMTVQLVPASGTPLDSPYVKTAVSTKQFTLTGSDGSTWSDLAPSAGPSISFTAPYDGSMFVSGNADLWTTVTGSNQDLGITVQGGAYPTTSGQPEFWKESGGFAGTFSPNAAAVSGMLAVSRGVTYTLKLQWKTNRPGAGTIVAGAGPIAGAYSPSRLSLWLVPTGARIEAVSTQQYALTNSDGVIWSDMDPTILKLSITPTNNCVATLSANADLWTATAGINQDLGIEVSSTLGTYSADRAGWKESGGFAGTFSPNAASIHTLFPMSASITYSVKLEWKANQIASGASIYAGAGPIGSKFSPTRLTAQLTCPAPATGRITTAPQSVTAGSASGPIMVQLVDTYGNPAPAGPGGQTFAISSSSSSGQSVTLDTNGVPASTLTIPAGASSASFKFKDAVAESVTVQVQATGFTTLTQVETVNPGITAQFKLTAPSTAIRSVPFNLTVTAEDKYGNTTPAYGGTIHFTSSDPAAVLPPNYMFVGSDNGVHTFSVTLNTVGSQTVTATDTTTSQVTGTSGSITVN